MKNYTPGPWSVTIFESGGKAIVQRGESGGFYVNGFCTKTQNADAMLIAAAPDLLESLELCRDALLQRGVSCDKEHPDNIAISAADAAIEMAGCKS